MSFSLPKNTKETNNPLRKAGASKRERSKITQLFKSCCFAAVPHSGYFPELLWWCSARKKKKSFKPRIWWGHYFSAK